MNKSLLILYNNFYNKDVIVNNFNQSNDKVFNFFNQEKVLKDYDEKLLTFPIFRNKNHPIIENLSNFDNLKIRSLFDGDINVLKDMIIKELLHIKNTTDKYSENQEELMFINSLQKCILNNEFLRDDNTNNFLTYILNENVLTNYVCDSYCEVTIIEVYLLFFILHNVLRNSNFNQLIITDILTYTDLNNELLITGMNNFLNLTNFKNLITSVSKNIFFKFNTSDNFNNKSLTFFINNITQKLKDSYIDYLENKDINSIFIKRVLPNIFNCFVFDKFKDMIEINIFDFFNNSNFEYSLDVRLSADSINQIIDDLSIYDLQEYIIPLFIYKNNTNKFINSMLDYIDVFIDTKYEFDNILLRNEIFNYFDNTIKNINGESIQNYINTNITSINNLEDIGRFFLSLELIKDFCNSKEFTDFIINDFLKQFNKHLFKDKWINNDINWFKNIEMIRHYFMSYFLKNYKLIFNNVLSNSLNHDNFEIFGDVNGYVNNLLYATNNKEELVKFQDNLYRSHLKKQLYFKFLSYFLITP